MGSLVRSNPIPHCIVVQLCEHNYGMPILEDVEDCFHNMWRLVFGSKGAS
jgi:hypothetical protein